MRELFRSWKRKVGVVTMAIALTFAAGWIRGHFVIDKVFFSGEGQSLNSLILSR